jgi:hypothetical protein
MLHSLILIQYGQDEIRIGAKKKAYMVLQKEKKEKVSCFLSCRFSLKAFPGYRKQCCGCESVPICNFFGWMDTGRTIFFCKIQFNLGHFYTCTVVIFKNVSSMFTRFSITFRYRYTP